MWYYSYTNYKLGRVCVPVEFNLMLDINLYNQLDIVRSGEKIISCDLQTLFLAEKIITQKKDKLDKYFQD